LDKEGYTYTEKNVSDNVEYAEELVSFGYRVTPVTFVGTTSIVGFSPNKLKDLLRDDGIKIF
tara:strand:- start:688 stop:873 length:186 start_codon:yes stop_codon:yes gene_type:complete